MSTKLFYAIIPTFSLAVLLCVEQVLTLPRVGYCPPISWIACW